MYIWMDQKKFPRGHLNSKFHVNNSSASRTLKQNLFIPGCTSTTWECVIHLEEIIQFCVQLIRVYAKNWIMIYRKNAIRKGKTIFHVVMSYRVSSIKFHFWLVQDDCLFSWTLCPTLNQSLKLQKSTWRTFLSPPILWEDNSQHNFDFTINLA